METVELTPLETLGDLLIDSDYLVNLEVAGANSPIDKLYIEVGELEDETLILQGLVVNEFFDLTSDREAEAEELDDEAEATLFQFWLVFPVEIEADPMEVMKTASLINRLLTVGYFGVSLTDRSFFLQYALPIDGNDISPLVAFETINMLAFAATEYGKALAAVARGQLTAEAYEAALAENGIVFPPVPAAARTSSETDEELSDEEIEDSELADLADELGDDIEPS